MNGGPETSTAGQWLKEEIKSKNINFQEMKAALYTLKALCNDCRSTSVALRVDNMATVGAIRNMGSRSLICDGSLKTCGSGLECVTYGSQ